ncbi:hypothetical protein AT959_10165 [Dechloromonas denitrificans]|uniref:Porin domain-containing protein n=1 Tax=Dechloromonas denitrificans TaxID=281362 RepID=A0A133XJD9_9RHOO|nr:porin [Dechloromonas denitrificans]KXB31055.1 hypothetical protein AT959_10165 [Dechloromonas denitrificans]
MQKKIIALAVAGLASTAAFAQSNVTIYGSVDMGYAYRYDSNNRNVDSNSAIDGGQAQGNRLGFKGVEDLGNGLKAVFLLEQGFGVDASSDATTAAGTNKSISFTRQAYVGLTGGFGTAIAGRLYTPHFSFVSAIDPFSAGTVGQYKNVYGGGLFDPTRVDNAVAYVSPSFGGFTVTGAYSNNAIAQESSIDNSQNNTVYALLARYTAGPVDVGFNVHRIAGASGNGVPTTMKSIDNYTLGGTFDAKVVKIHGLISHNIQDNATGTNDVQIDNYMIGATVPVGKFAIKTSYMFSDGNSAAGGNAQQFAVGGNYALSKRTDLYTAYSIIDNDSATQNGVTLRRAAVVGDASNSGMTFQQGFQVGVRHLF